MWSSHATETAKRVPPMASRTARNPRRNRPAAGSAAGSTPWQGGPGRGSEAGNGWLAIVVARRMLGSGGAPPADIRTVAHEQPRRGPFAASPASRSPRALLEHPSDAHQDSARDA